MDLDLRAPSPAHGVHQPFVAGTPMIPDAEAAHDPRFVTARAGVCRRRRLRFDGDVQNLFFLGTEQRQDAMRRHLGQVLGEIEIIAEFGASLLFTVAHLGREPADRPHLLAQRADQIGVLREAFDQDRAGAVERGGSVGDLLLGIDEAHRRDRWIVLWSREQQIGQRLEAGLFGYLGLGAALRLERQIDVFKSAFAGGGANCCFERVIELALIADRIQDDDAALLKLAQIAQAFVERAQLRIIERAGRFLAIAGNEGQGCALVEHRPRGCDLLFANAKLLCDLSINGSGHACTYCDGSGCRDGADNSGPPHGADMDVGALILQPPKLQCPRRDSRQNQNGRRTSGFAHEYYPLFPASADTSTPTSASLSHPSTRSTIPSACVSLHVRRASLRNFSTTSASLANFCSLPRGAVTVSLSTVPSVNRTSTRTICRNLAPRAVMAGSCATSTLAASAMRPGSVTTASEN